MSNTAKEILEWIGAMLIGIVIVVVFRTFIMTNYEVVGKSMMPTLQDRDRVAVSKLAKIERMDIVIFHGEDDEDYVKRIIGVPGDKIVYENDTLYINDKKVMEKFLRPYPAFQHPEENFTEDFELFELTGNKTVPPNKFFVLGDNRLASMDSRYFSFIAKKDIVGEVKAKYWPIREAKIQFDSE